MFTRLYFSDDQSQNKLIRITIVFYKPTSRGKEAWVVDALCLEHYILYLSSSDSALSVPSIKQVQQLYDIYKTTAFRAPDT